MDKYNMVRRDTGFVYSVVFDNAKYDLLKESSTPRAVPAELVKINYILLDAGYGPGCPGLIDAMNYSMPKWDFMFMDNNKRSATRALLKGIIAEISLDSTIYAKCDDLGIVKSFIIVNSDRALTDHWSEGDLVLYQTRLK